MSDIRLRGRCGKIKDAGKRPSRRDYVATGGRGGAASDVEWVGVVKKVKRFRAAARSYFHEKGRWRKCFERWQENKRLTRVLAPLPRARARARSPYLPAPAREKGSYGEIEFGNRRAYYRGAIFIGESLICVSDLLNRSANVSVTENKKKVDTTNARGDLSAVRYFRFN